MYYTNSDESSKGGRGLGDTILLGTNNKFSSLKNISYIKMFNKPLRVSAIPEKKIPSCLKPLRRDLIDF